MSTSAKAKHPLLLWSCRRFLLESRGVCIIGCSATGSKLEWSRCRHLICWSVDEPEVNGLVAAGAAKAEGGAPPPFPGAAAGAGNETRLSFLRSTCKTTKTINLLIIN